MRSMSCSLRAAIEFDSGSKCSSADSAAPRASVSENGAERTYSTPVCPPVRCLVKADFACSGAGAGDRRHPSSSGTGAASTVSSATSSRWAAMRWPRWVPQRRSVDRPADDDRAPQLLALPRCVRATDAERFQVAGAPVTSDVVDGLATGLRGGFYGGGGWGTSRTSTCWVSAPPRARLSPQFLRVTTAAG